MPLSRTKRNAIYKKMLEFMESNKYVLKRGLCNYLFDAVLVLHSNVEEDQINIRLFPELYCRRPWWNYITQSTFWWNPNGKQRRENLYKALIEAGVAKESARFVLPLCTQTKIYMKGSVRSWIHYLQIRCDEHTQLEHRQIALEIQQIFIEQFPNISKALLWK